jgi:pimeloyl-ACP methyl ester carboxylesterase
VESVGSFLGSILGGILAGVDKFINLTSWYVMKNRSGVVGAAGVAQAVRDLKANDPNLLIHLVGHSLGGRLMAACAKSLAQDPQVQPDSLTLLEAAFSHYGFSPNNGKGTPGFFRDIIAKQVVKGPLLETFSFQDTVVGTAYAIASRLAGDNAKAVGDANDEFGGIGRNGAQLTSESVFVKLKDAAAPDGDYAFAPRVVTCLDGSGGLIKDHGDVTNASVTLAFASAVAATAPLGKTQAGSAAS